MLPAQVAPEQGPPPYGVGEEKKAVGRDAEAALARLAFLITIQELKGSWQILLIVLVGVGFGVGFVINDITQANLTYGESFTRAGCIIGMVYGVTSLIQISRNHRQAALPEQFARGSALVDPEKQRLLRSGPCWILTTLSVSIVCGVATWIFIVTLPDPYAAQLGRSTVVLLLAVVFSGYVIRNVRAAKSQELTYFPGQGERTCVDTVSDWISCSCCCGGNAADQPRFHGNV